MRVLVVHNRYRSAQPSGENVVVDQQVDLLRDAGHDVELYSRSSDDIAELPLAGRAMVPVRSLWSRYDARALAERLGRSRPDLIHVHNTFPLISPSVLRAAAGARVPVVATLHNFRLMCANALLQRDGRPCEDCVGGRAWHGVRHGCYRGSAAASVPLAAGIEMHRRLGTWTRGVTTFVAPSRFVKSRYEADGYDPDRIVVKPTGVPHRGPVRSGPGGPFVFLGRLAPEKGVADLLAAWRPEFGRLVIAGDGPLRAEVEQAAAADPTISYRGVLSWEQCMELVSTARAVVVPPRWYEAYGMVVVEAFAHGVPVVAARIGAIAELVEHDVNGLAVEPGEVGQLAEALRRMTDPALSERYGAGARASYLGRFTPAQDLAATERLYADTIDRYTS